MAQNQSYLFYVFLLVGILIGLLFDLFRVIRKSFKHSDFATIIQDIVFFLLSATIIIYTLFKFNNGILRSYVFLGICAGIFIYLILFSKIFIKVNVKIMEIIKKIAILILYYISFFIRCFLKLIKRTLFKPVSFVFINIRKIGNVFFYNISKILKKKHNKTKKNINKEGFYNNV